MKVAFIGTHGVGKTTLCFDLAAVLKKLDFNVDIVKEVARSCPLPINRLTNEAAQSWILHTQIAKEIELSYFYGTIICDRSVIDNYAYLVHRSGASPLMDRIVNNWIKTYDFLFKVPIIGEPRPDGIRDTDPFFQREIDQQIDALLMEREIPFYNLISQNRSSWIDEIQRIISEFHEPISVVGQRSCSDGMATVAHLSSLR